MGFDVYGKAPVSEKGKYFRRDAWWWHPLVFVCEAVAPEIAKRCKGWHANDGYGLDRNCARKLGKKLDKHLKDGTLDRVLRRILVDLQFHTCPACRGYGAYKLTKLKTVSGFDMAVPLDDEREGEVMPCDMCLKVGRLNPASRQHYWNTPEQMREFAEFCKDSGGFEIR